MDQPQLKNFYNADCMEIMKTMEDKSVEMILTDIPFNIDSLSLPIPVYGTDEFGNKVFKYWRNHDKSIEKTPINQFNVDELDFLKECLRIASGSVLIFCELKQAVKMRDYLTTYQKKCGGSSRVMIWNITNKQPNNCDKIYIPNVEYIILYKHKGATFKPYTNYPNCVFSYPMEMGERIHPCEKNHALLKQLIEENTNKGDVVFDPCMGSGATCLCAIQTGRQTIGIEIDKDIYDRAMLRMQDKGYYQFDLLEDFNE